MKHLCTTFFFLCCILQGAAQTLHFILFTDTNDESIGRGIQKSKDYLCYELIPKIRQKTDLKVTPYVYSGSSFTRSNLNSVISSLSTSSDDTILFYYDGHGYNDTTNDFPSFSLGSGDVRQGQTLLSVYQELQKKPHRLLVAISASCNKLPHGESGEFDDGRGAAGEPINIYKKLFQLSSGDYMVSSSRKDEYSWVVNKYGDLFTIAFRQVIEHWYDTPPSWSDFLNAVSRQCTILASWLNCSQHPQWISGYYYDGKAKDNQQSSRYETVMPNAEIKKVWVDHNVLKTFGMMQYYCMVIHCHFVVRNMKDKLVSCTAYFFHGNGNKLIDTNGAFRSFDGQIATGDTYTPKYERSVMEDFELVIPYSELHVFPGWNTPIKIVVCITDSNNTPLAQSDYYSFTY